MLILWLFAGCAPAAQEYTDNLVFHLDDAASWKVGHHTEDRARNYAITELIRKSEDINSWSEMITVENFPLWWGGKSVSEALESLIVLRDKECPGTTEWQVIEGSPKTVSYENHTAECKGYAAHHEVGKIMDGRFNRFRVRYTQTTRSMPTEERDKWAHWVTKEVRLELQPVSR